MRPSARPGRPAAGGRAVAALLAAGLALAAGPSRAQEWNLSRTLHRDRDGPGPRTAVAVLAGARVLDSSDWDPVAVQPQIGIDVSFAPPESPLSFCGTLLYSAASGSASSVDVTASIAELQLGLRKDFHPAPRWRAYGGAGGSVLQVEYDVDASPEARHGNGLQTSGTSTGWGLWAGGGAYYRFGQGWIVGADARYVWAPVEISGQRANGGGFQMSLGAGYRWSGW